MFSFTDGTSNTILVAEASTAVPWTKPDEELIWDGAAIPPLGPRKSGTYLVLMADGAVHAADEGGRCRDAAGRHHPQRQRLARRRLVTTHLGEIEP